MSAPNAKVALVYALSEAKRSLLDRLFGRAFLALGDQGMVSVATFITGWFVTKVSKEEAGLYTMSLSLWVLLSEVHNSLVSNPHMIRVPKLRGRILQAFNGSTLTHQLILSAVLTVLTLMAANVAWAHGARDEASILLVSALGTMPVTLRNYARNFCFATRRADHAFVLDGFVSALQVGGVIVLAWMHKLGAVNAVLVLAAANLISTIGWLVFARSSFSMRGKYVRCIAKHNWQIGKWIFASSMMWVAGMNLYPWVINGLRGAGEAGVFGACGLLASLGNPLVTALQNHLGPSIAHAHDEMNEEAFRRYVLRATIGFALLVLPISVGMALFSQRLLDLLYKGQYAGNGPVAAVLVFAIVAQAGSFAASRGLFCIGRAKLDMMTNIVPIGILLTLGVWAVWRMARWARRSRCSSRRRRDW
ncbi:MAG: oligosaccharide flippase family protein [Tepidisphaeraceae bacterium]